MLETNFGQEDEDEGKPLLQPTNHGFQLGQSRGWSAGLFVAALLGVAVAVPGHVQQRGAAVVAVVEVMGRGPRVERGPLSAAGALLPRGRHLDEHLAPSGRRAQHQPRREGSGRDGARGDPGQPREELLRGGGLGLEALEHAALIHAGLRADRLAPVPAGGQRLKLNKNK